MNIKTKAVKKNRWLIISDVHANMDALTTCLEKAKQIGYDKIACLGDLVGYGPNPNEVVAWAIETQKNDPDSVFVMGNHDESISNLNFDISCYNPHARYAIQFQRKQITDATRKFLSSLPKHAKSDGLQFVHGSPINWDDYILSVEDAVWAVKSVTESVCFVGHTHVPNIWLNDKCEIKIINVGSVGQPRDGNPESCFMIYDLNTKIPLYTRVPYDVKAVQDKMTELEISDHLIRRLANGR